MSGQVIQNYKEKSIKLKFRDLKTNSIKFMKSKKEIFKKLENYRELQESLGQSNYLGWCFHIVKEFQKKWRETLEEKKGTSGDNLETGLYYKTSKGIYVHVPGQTEGINVFDHIDFWGYRDGATDALLWVISEEPRHLFIPTASSKYKEQFERQKRDSDKDEEDWPEPD